MIEEDWAVSNLRRGEDFNFGEVSFGYLEDGTYEIQFEIEDNAKLLYRSERMRVHVVRAELVAEIRGLIEASQ